VILIVDDMEDGAVALCKLLTRAGYPCANVTSGREALAAIRAHPPEQPLLVILDEMMPEMTGIDVLRKLRDDPATSATKVLFLSAGFDVGKREEALALGAVAWLLKGSGYSGDFNTLLQRIGDWYEKAGGVKNTLHRENISGGENISRGKNISRSENTSEIQREYRNLPGDV
jgi:CheY-like chemotaxis protein